MPDATPDATEIRAALARLIASPAFSKSPQLAHFLTFVVDKTLAGRDDLVIIELPRGSYMPVFHVNTAPRRTVARMRRLRRQLAEAISEKYRLVLLIVVIAAAVSLTVEVLEKTIWPSIQNAVWSSPPATSPPATSSPDSTGALNR